MQKIKRKGISIYDKIIKPFAKASKTDTQLHARVFNIELPQEPHETSTWRGKSPFHNISTINLENKPEKSPPSSHSSSSGEETSQCIQLQNQELQIQNHSAECEKPTELQIGSPSVERFLTHIEDGIVRRKKRIKSAKD